MKIRTDFVTNSSSSSFILARKETLNEKQKEALVEFGLSMLGEKVLSPGATEEDIRHFLEEDLGRYHPTYELPEIKDCLDSGMSIYSGEVLFQGYSVLRELYQRVWKMMEDADEYRTYIIDGDLELE